MRKEIFSLPTLIIGDTHANWGILNQIITNFKPHNIIVCGDFGYWPSAKSLVLPDNCLKTKKTKIYFCDGNHEDHWKLIKLHEREKSDIVEVYPNVFHIKRGTVVNICGIKYMFMGGAESKDKPYRTNGFDLFEKEEVISTAEFMDMDLSQDFDVVISHTCPEEVMGDYIFSKIYEKVYSKEIQEYKNNGLSALEFFRDRGILNDNDPTRKALDTLIEKKPKFWFHGHWHFGNQFVYKDINFNSMDRVDSKYHPHGVLDGVIWMARAISKELFTLKPTKQVTFSEEYRKQL